MGWGAYFVPGGSGGPITQPWDDWSDGNQDKCKCHPQQLGQGWHLVALPTGRSHIGGRPLGLLGRCTRLLFRSPSGVDPVRAVGALASHKDVLGHGRHGGRLPEAEVHGHTYQEGTQGKD